MSNDAVGAGLVTGQPDSDGSSGARAEAQTTLSIRCCRQPDHDPPAMGQSGHELNVRLGPSATACDGLARVHRGIRD